MSPCDHEAPGRVSPGVTPPDLKTLFLFLNNETQFGEHGLPGTKKRRILVLRAHDRLPAGLDQAHAFVRDEEKFDPVGLGQGKIRRGHGLDKMLLGRKNKLRRRLPHLVMVHSPDDTERRRGVKARIALARSDDRHRLAFERPVENDSVDMRKLKGRFGLDLLGLQMEHLEPELAHDDTRVGFFLGGEARKKLFEDAQGLAVFSWQAGMILVFT